MIEIKKISTTYKENNNRDYKETYRELETNKKLGDVVAECMTNDTEFHVFVENEEVNIYELKTIDYMKLSGKFVKEVEKHITEIKSDSANVYKSSMIAVIKL